MLERYKQKIRKVNMVELIKLHHTKRKGKELMKIIVKELKRQMEYLESLGYGEFEIYHGPADDDFVEPMAQGLWDSDTEHKVIILA